MSNLKEKIKALPDNKKHVLLIAVIVVSLLALIAFETMGSSEAAAPKERIIPTAEEYIASTEKQLKSILSQVEGAGDVHVMITLESCYENVFAKDYSNKTDTQKDSSNINVTEELVVVKNTDGEGGVVIKVCEPVVKGVAVVCEGADNIKVKSAITEAVCALFDISSTKVSVTKGQKER
jgi:stage III sporulation protein AG